MLFESVSSPPNNDETNCSESNVQNFDQTFGDQHKPEDKPRQESGHYWWCPCFEHLSTCYMNNGFQDPNQWWSQMPVYSGHHYQMAKNNNQRPKSVVSERKPKEFSVTKTPKTDGTQIERLYSCRLCDQLNETKDVSLLRQHIEDHLGKCRPFFCQVCGKEFKFRSNCRNHLVAHSVVRKNFHRLSQSSIKLDIN